NTWKSKTINSILEISKQLLTQNTSIMKRQEALEVMLYPNNKVYEEAIQKELEILCLDKMERYRKGTKWEALFNKIENVKSSDDICWCLENLDTMVEEKEKAYLQMVAKKVFGRQITNNQYAVTRAVLHNFFNPKIIKIKFDEKYLM
ncbi:21210_t:CDS:2, partial [Cetraspora pellucida]